MAKKYFVVDPSRCIGCRSCETACRNEFLQEHGAKWRRVKEVEIAESGLIYFLSLACNHCENPECFRVCPERTYFKRRDGVVVHNSKRCTGCCNCVRACPFGAPQYSPVTGKVDKCSMCVHLLDKGLPPACVEACPTGALRLVSEHRPLDEHELLTVPGFDRALLTKPSTRFVISAKNDRRWEEIAHEHRAPAISSLK